MGKRLEHLLLFGGLTLLMAGVGLQLSIGGPNYERTKNTPSLRNTIVNYGGAATAVTGSVLSVAGLYHGRRKFPVA